PRGAPKDAPRPHPRTPPTPGGYPRHHRPLPPPPAPPPCVTQSLRRSISGAAARRTTVEAFVASPVAHHQRAAFRTARRIGLGAERDRRLRCRTRARKPDGMAGGRRGTEEARGNGRRPDFFCWRGDRPRTANRLVTLDETDGRSLLAGEEARAEEPENVVDERLRHRDVGILGEARRLEAYVAELRDQDLERDAELERHRGGDANGGHEARDRAPLLGHLDEDLARGAVLEEADVDVALMPGDVELVADRLAVRRQAAAHRARRRSGLDRRGVAARLGGVERLGLLAAVA